MQYIQSNTSNQTVNISSLRGSADVPPPFCRLATLVTPTIKSNFLKRWDGKSHFSSKPGVYLRVLVNYLKLFGIADFNTG